MNQEMISLASSVYFNFQHGLMKIALAWLRIAPVMFFLPFLSNKLLNGGIIKNCVVAYLALGMWPYLSARDIDWAQMSLSEVFLYEICIGIVLALILGLPFMIANIIGELIDTQRGETISSIVDPASGSEASELAVFISYIVCMVFLAQGGMYQLANVFAQSYQLLPFAHGFTSFNSLPLAEWLNKAVVNGVILTAPIIVTLFISEVALGLYSRFCPQLNAFSLSLAIKSIIAFIVFLLYFQNEVPDILVNMISMSPLNSVFLDP
ncbi:type III secretion system protein SpaR [Providencia rustigianii]|uniref:Type III secretion apparatus protein SpaR/YscT/HrcT n=2 Tax=Providencia rustigianii TaxID=158850 RepID=D1P119_9GAMM|nr:type III secretion system export apparatus subunit SctT [Providencia rustigianii]EFB73038.1 type III secretion apparatus protein SpaR/YscT/HrcT [Providencia rustigianii DSM 4541]MTC59642.1 EscT/YscT/HrcT family type III secretion system export apparatus protein [Providencia rustigianii]SPY76084.1 type III secretion system protein SpaR [Providencia rustigianii]SUC34054.1 type III secretion system protein SpaR [Providencia rustigianii]VEB63074.1 type III secretion system protein SpaR [Provide